MSSSSQSKSAPRHPGNPHHRTLFTRLERLCRKVRTGAEAEDVHHLRTTVRRIETLLAAGGGTHRRLGKQLKRLRRRAGKVRDLDVQIHALSGIHLETINGDKTKVMQALESARRRQQRKLSSVITAELDEGLKKRLHTTADKLERSARGEERRDYAALALRRFASISRKFKTLNESNLHEFRMEGKRVRYLAELGSKPEAEQIVTHCKRMQDAVGEWHDWMTLADFAEEELGKSNSPLLSALRTAQRSKFMGALRVVEEVRANLLALGGAGPRQAPRLKREPVAARAPRPARAASA